MSHRRGVLVTGASTGIGRATALELARGGFHVLAGVRRAADGESVQTEAHGELEPLILDITDPAAIEAAAGRVEELVGRGGLVALVNNAGVAHGGPLEFLPLDDLRHQLEVNLIGHLAVTRAMLPQLRAARGRIVNVSSIEGLVATPFIGAYCASKFALEAVGDCLRGELRPWGIRVVTIEPGVVATEIWDRGRALAADARAHMGPEGERLYGEAIDRVAAASAEFGARGMPPEEVARAIHKAITVRRPRARYMVGRDAVAIKLTSRLLPDRIFDALVARRLNLPR